MRGIIICFLQYQNNIFINLKTITIFKRKGATFVSNNGCGKPLFANGQNILKLRHPTTFAIEGRKS